MNNAIIWAERITWVLFAGACGFAVWVCIVQPPL